MSFDFWMGVGGGFSLGFAAAGCLFAIINRQSRGYR